MKTLDLSQFEVTDLSKGELLIVEGGLHPFIWMGIAWAIDGVIEAVTGKNIGGHIAGTLSGDSGGPLLDHMLNGLISTAPLSR